MVSPLSLAKFLPAGSIEFDVLVIDEASQMKPEDALGGLLRTRQVVVVGDQKQLPPTDFFARSGGGDATASAEDEDFDRARAALERAQAGARPPVEVSPMAVEQFGWTMRENLTTGEIPFRKTYLGSLADRVEVDDSEIRIVGRNVLERAILANGVPVPGVRSFVRKWRTGEDSNSRPPDS